MVGDSQLNSAFAVSFHSTKSDARVRFDSGAIFLDRSQFFAKYWNEIVSFCINHRSRQMAFLLAKAGQRRGKKPAFALC